MTSPLKTSLLLAALVACSGGYAQSTMTRDQAKAEHDRIEATAKADKKACDAMEGNAEDVCEAEAKAKEAEENERIARLLSDEAERKAKRDARYAARKARAGRH